jgi:Tol biopolymer transport system component
MRAAWWMKDSGLLVALIALIAAGCKGESITDRDPDAVFGMAVVQVSTYGVNLDPDGYMVDVRGLEQHNVPVSGQVDLRVLAGPARLTLSGVAPNCHLAGDPDLTVTIEPGTPTLASYVVTCGSGKQHVAFSSNRSGAADIFVLMEGTTDPVQVTSDPWSDTDPVWSPSGNRIAYATLSPDSATVQIAIVSIDGTRLATIGTPGSFTGYPAWSPRDDRLVFSSNVSGNTELYLMDEGNSIVQLTHTPTNEFRPAWSPDGTQIVYDLGLPDTLVKRDLFIINADGTGHRHLDTGGKYNFNASWSPDGRWIAFISQRDGNEEIYATSLTDGTLIRLTSHGASDASPAWTADGKSIIFESRRSGFANLYRRALTGGETIQITSAGFDDIDPAVSR